VFLGVSDYQTILSNKENFVALEKQKISQFVTYEQYGLTGFRVMFVHTPLMVFFRNSTVIGDIEGNIDASEIIKIYELQKGQKVFSRKGNFFDLKNVIFIFGTLLCLYLGLATFRSEELVKFLGRKYFYRIIGSRFLLVNIYLLILFALSYGTALVWGVEFPTESVHAYKTFCLFSILFLDIFLVAGMLFSSRLKNFGNASVVALLFWIVMVFVFPEILFTSIERSAQKFPSLEKINLEKQKILMDWERKSRTEFLATTKERKLSYEEAKELAYELHSEFIKDGYAKNKQTETGIIDKVKHLVETYETRSSYFPGNYFLFLAGEISGAGYNEYIGFSDYIQNLRDQFIDFYRNKRFRSNDTSVEPFVKENENVYISRNRIPDSLNNAVSLLLIYFFFAVILLMVKKRETFKPSVSIEIPETFEENHILFILTKKEKKEELFKSLSQTHESLSLPIYNYNSFSEEIKAAQFILMAVRLNKLDRKKVFEYIEHFGIAAASLETKLSELSSEIMKKIVFSLISAKEGTLVIDDFIKNESKEFEKQFLEILTDLSGKGRKIIYVSNQLYHPVASIEQKVRIETYKPFLLDPQNVSLR
jgi:ABC-type transport system involved in multi-copper enzyme maturation permease subunit